MADLIDDPDRFHLAPGRPPAPAAPPPPEPPWAREGWERVSNVPLLDSGGYKQWWGQSPVDDPRVAQAYRDLLGREMGPEDRWAHRGNTRGVEGILEAIRTSPEARARAAQASTPTPTGTATGTAFTAKGQGGRGSPSWTYTGFDFEQADANRDVGRSAKYAFAEATRQAADQGVGDIWKTKAGAQWFAEQYVKPFLEQQGFKVFEIVGDKMRILTREAAEAGNTDGVWIDFVVNADGPNPALAWQEEQTRTAFGTLEGPFDTSAFGPSSPAPTAPEKPGHATDGNRGTTEPTSSPYVDESIADPTLYALTFKDYYDRWR